MSDPAALQQASVTRNDAQDAKATIGPHIIQPFYLWGLELKPILPDLPMQWTRHSDWYLRQTIYFESLWSAGIRKAISKVAARSYQTKDVSDSERRKNQAQKLFQTYDGLGWVAGISRTVADYLTTDNGAFVQIVRQTGAKGSRVRGFKHLDSRRCTRTGDPAYPVIYEDLHGQQHYLKDYQVMVFQEQPRPEAELYGVGMCAARGAYPMIQYLASLRLYEKEKVSGSGATAWYIIQGITDTTLTAAAQTGDSAQRTKGNMLYKGALVTGLPGAGQGEQANLITIPLKSLPDGFNLEQTFDDAVIIYSNHLGIQVQDIRPLSGQFGAGEQTRVLDEAANAMGQAAFVKDLEHQINDKALPASTTFYLTVNDMHDQKLAAEVSKLRAETRKQMIDNGEIDATIARQMALDAGDLAPELFGEEDATPQVTLTDSQKPVPDNAAPAADPMVMDVDPVEAEAMA